MLLVALGLVAVSSAGARAVDLCLDFSGGGGVALKRFKAPSRNKCVPIQGIDNESYPGALSGTGCTSATGDRLILHYTYHSFRTTGYFESATCRLVLPIDSAIDGSCAGTYLTSPGTGQTYFSQSVTARFCSVDIPN